MHNDRKIVHTKVYLHYRDEAQKRLVEYKNSNKANFDVSKAMAFFIYIRHTGFRRKGYTVFDLKRWLDGELVLRRTYWGMTPLEAKKYFDIFEATGLGKYIKNGDAFIPTSPKKIGDTSTYSFITLSVVKYISFEAFYDYYVTTIIAENIAKQKFAMIHRYFSCPDNNESKSTVDVKHVKPSLHKKARTKNVLIKMSGYNSDPHVSCRLLGKLLGVSHTTANNILKRLDGKILTFKEDVRTIAENVVDGFKYHDDSLYCFQQGDKVKVHLGRKVKVIPIQERRNIYQGCFLSGDIDRYTKFLICESSKNEVIIDSNFIEDTSSNTPY